jgi:abequosyltransferase
MKKSRKKDGLMTPFVSICIPSYNRPTELIRLLESINSSCKSDLEIVICEDRSPKRSEIVNSIADFKEKSQLKIQLYLNEVNLGYDANLRHVIDMASGQFIIFMGDDDVFYHDNLPNFIDFLRKNSHLGYVLKNHTLIHRNGRKEEYKYYSDDKFFPKGLEGYQSLFRKSGFISGFCIQREFVLPVQTDIFDGCLIYQLYLLAELTLNYPSAYCSIPLVIQDENLRGTPLFGTSDVEKELYKPGEITVESSLRFIDGHFKITSYIDKKYGLNSTANLKHNFSKYSFPIISFQRNRGKKIFKEYCKELEQRIQINQSFYYYIYYYSLLFFGKKFCDQSIVVIKKILGKTPSL